MPDLYELERRFRAANRDLRNASDRLCDARDYLERNPVSARAVQEGDCALHIVNTLFEKYAVAKAELGRIDRDVAQDRCVAERLRAQLDRKNFLTSPTGLVVTGFAEVVLVFLLSLVCLLNLPIGVWAVLFLLASFGAVSLTVLWASHHRKASQPRRDYLAGELAAAEHAVAERQRDRRPFEETADKARAMWEKADRVFQELKAQIRPKLRYDKAAREYEEALQDYNRIRERYEAAQTERRLRLLDHNWRDLRAGPFEQFVEQVFQCLGFTTELTKASGDQGIDVIATKDGVRWGIQCKGYADNVGNDAVQQAFTGARIYRCERCVVVTNSGFTGPAQEAAHHTECILVSGRDIPALIRGELRFLVSYSSRG
jgi:HJR/Mrr/RecB family endonuclease